MMIGTMAGNRWRIAGWGMAAVLLAAPLVAMRFTAEVAWSGSDFIVAAALLGGAGLAIEIAVRRTSDGAYRLGMAATALGCLMLLWLTGAVGIIGSERDSANLLFLAVPAIAVAGALTVRLAVRGMAGVLVVMAVVQLGVPLISLILRPDLRPAILSPEVPLLTALFAALWLGAAWLFRRSAMR